MNDAAAAAAQAHQLYWGRVLSATLRMARDVDIAEEATADAFLLALQTWPERGVPDSVEAWLLTAARRRAIDRIRRLVRLRERLPTLAAGDEAGPTRGADAVVDLPLVADDELRLVVLCCHPAIDQEAQVALTLRLGCGVPTASIAAAFLVSTPTMAARLTRAKQRIAGSGDGIDLPDDVAVEERMPAVRRTVHLGYTMGHTAGSGVTLRDDDLAGHAVRLARSLHDLRPDDTETAGLLALVLLTEARAATRLDAGGGQVLLENADRSRWDGALIAEGLDLVAGAAAAGAGPLVLQATIAADHARAPSFEATDWGRMIRHYDALLLIEPSPTVAIGRCVALSYLIGPQAALADLDDVLAVVDLTGYPYAHAARAQMLERLARHGDAAAAWRGRRRGGPQRRRAGVVRGPRRRDGRTSERSVASATWAQLTGGTRVTRREPTRTPRSTHHETTSTRTRAKRRPRPTIRSTCRRRTTRAPSRVPSPRPRSRSRPTISSCWRGWPARRRWRATRSTTGTRRSPRPSRITASTWPSSPMPRVSRRPRSPRSCSPRSRTRVPSPDCGGRHGGVRPADPRAPRPSSTAPPRPPARG